MKRKIVMIITLIILIIILIIFSFKLYKYIKIKNAKIDVKLIDNLNLEFNDKKNISYFIKSINGKIVNDYVIDSSKIGKKKVNFEFINDDNIKVKYFFNVNIIDSKSPLIWVDNSYTVNIGTDIDLTKKILCGDNYDNNPTCIIEGYYNLNELGNYPLTFKATDKSGNETIKKFTLNVIEEKKNNQSISTSTSFKKIKEEYQNMDVEIGLDISRFQGDIDFAKLKQAGVDFLMLRLGGSLSTNNEYFIDSKFEEYAKLANEYKIPIGVYFYSYANSSKTAIKDAKWVLNQIKNYDIELPIALDWEEWGNFNNYNLSFFGLTNLANDFLDEIKKSGYKTMLYSSKKYLENIWMQPKHDIWLAHYTNKTDYNGKYKMWQLCNNGKIDGINNFVDIDIMY